jgi:hypothetical protein
MLKETDSVFNTEEMFYLAGVASNQNINQNISQLTLSNTVFRQKPTMLFST